MNVALKNMGKIEYRRVPTSFHKSSLYNKGTKTK